MNDPYYEDYKTSSAAERKYIIASIGILIVIIYICRIIWWAATGPTTEEAFQYSLMVFQDRNTAKDAQIHIENCSIKGSRGFGWSVDCPGVYFNGEAGCRDVSWEMDVWGTPTDFNGKVGRFNTIGSQGRCP